MTVYKLARLLSTGRGKKIAGGSASVANGGTIDTGLNSVDTVILTTTDATHIAAATSVSGGTVTVGLKDNAGNNVGSAETVYWVAIGE